MTSVRHLVHLIDNTIFKLILEDPIGVGHYEIISLNGRSSSHKPDNETSPPSGSIATGPSRYAGTDEGRSSLSGSGFFTREGDEK